MHVLSGSPQSRPKSILKRPSGTDLQTRSRSSSTASKKSAAFDDVARDIVTGDEVPQSPIHSSKYRAFHKEYRQEAGKALLLAKIDDMFDDVLRRLEVKVCS
ncbi:hypothetical protein F5Y17DRAFT_457911 [Xylariaceae sp. FL0594]|nr:hypothetical protein F5Y17DRAFT_457911 [Xylariaceae sp. FL0594]